MRKNDACRYVKNLASTSRNIAFELKKNIVTIKDTKLSRWIGLWPFVHMERDDSETNKLTKYARG